MKIGVIYPQTELHGSPEAICRIGLASEELGFDHLLTYDHLLGATHDRQPELMGPYTEKDPFHDPFVMFAYLAGLTKRIEFVTGVLILPQRQTVLAARQAADLDLISKERLRLGVGTGWNYVEYDALGQDFHSRGKRIDEQIGLMRRLWSDPVMEFQGAFDRIDRAALHPHLAGRVRRCGAAAGGRSGRRIHLRRWSVLGRRVRPDGAAAPIPESRRPLGRRIRFPLQCEP